MFDSQQFMSNENKIEIIFGKNVFFFPWKLWNLFVLEGILILIFVRI